MLQGYVLFYHQKYKKLCQKKKKDDVLAFEIIDAKGGARRFLNMDPSEDVEDDFFRTISEESDVLSLDSGLLDQEGPRLNSRKLQRPTSKGRGK